MNTTPAILQIHPSTLYIGLIYHQHPHSLSKTAAVGRRGGKDTYLEMQSDERKH